MKIQVSNNFADAAAKFETKAKAQIAKIAANTLNNQAFAAREAVQAEMKRVFTHLEPATLNSVLVKKADVKASINEMVAHVYIQDYLPKGSVQPEKYLLTEEAGGFRVAKRSEKALQNAGIISAGMAMTPGPNMPLDAVGQPSGPAVVQMLSRLRAFGEMGYRSNATDETRKKLIRAARARASKEAKAAGLDAAAVKAARAGAFAPITKSGNEFFVGKAKDTRTEGVFRLVGRGKIQAYAWLTTRRPTYSARFPFRKIVAEAAAASFKSALARAIAFVVK